MAGRFPGLCCSTIAPSAAGEQGHEGWGNAPEKEHRVRPREINGGKKHLQDEREVVLFYICAAVDQAGRGGSCCFRQTRTEGDVSATARGGTTASAAMSDLGAALPAAATASFSISSPARGTGRRSRESRSPKALERAR